MSAHQDDGTKHTGTLKVSVGYVDSYVEKGRITPYASPGAVAQAFLALEIVAERLRLTRVQPSFAQINRCQFHSPGANCQLMRRSPARYTFELWAETASA